MKKVTTLLSALVLSFVGFTTVQAQEALFFSEYIEGSSNNKALEIYNASDETVSLANYQIAQSSNGGGWAYYHTFPEDAEIIPGGTYVMVTNQTDLALYDTTQANEVLSFPSLVHHNGDDARAIIYIADDDTTFIDVIGDPDNDPGSAWDVAGVTDATAEYTLIRKPSITEGNATVLGSFGTNNEDSEWIVKDQNYFSNLGLHPAFEVTFQVDMSAAIDSNQFVPETDFVTIPGDFNNWDNTADTLEAAGEGIYTTTLSLESGTYGYKFFVHSETPIGWENDPNRNIEVTDAEITLEPVSYNADFEFIDPDAETVMKTAVIDFSVDMSAQILTENFDPETDVVVVAGGYYPGGEWNLTADTLTAARGGDIYEGTVTTEIDSLKLPLSFGYKFVYKSEGVDNYEEPSIGPFAGDGNDRLLEITLEDYDAESDQFIVDANADGTPAFGDVSVEDFFTEDVTVTLKVDLRPAYYFLADSAGLPESANGVVADTIDFLIGNGTFITQNLDVDSEWLEWGAALGDVEGIVFKDDGENGDEVAGDSVFTLQVDFTSGDLRTGAFKLGVGGFDNESGFAVNHTPVVGDEQTIELIFGAIARGDSVYDDYYDEYILVTEEGPTVVRRGGTGDDGVTVSNEKERFNEAPAVFELSQNYPNPFNPTTNINFTIPEATDVKLTVYNVLGQEITRLVNNRLTAGSHTVQFDASNLASGMYLYRIEAGSFVQNKRMMLIK